jgi:hypothetical protein
MIFKEFGAIGDLILGSDVVEEVNIGTRLQRLTLIPF